MAPEIVELQEDHLPALRDVPGRAARRRRDVHQGGRAQPDTAASWVLPGARGRWWVATEDDGAVLGLVSVTPLVGWSSHVGDLRLVVAPEHRGRGLGAALARHGLRQALDAGLQKVVVEVVAAQEGAIRMFTDLGFRAEALLTDHIRLRSGELQDLLVLAHAAGDEESTLRTLGVEADVA
jgi:ribosomal protein S18 acetylase RimI-like enzyme